MQFERLPVLRFNLAAAALCVVSMIAFGFLIRETAARRAEQRARAAQMAEAQLQREIAENELRIQELIAETERIAERIRAIEPCTIGSHTSDAEIQRRLRQEALDARDELQQRIDTLRFPADL